MGFHTKIPPNSSKLPFKWSSAMPVDEATVKRVSLPYPCDCDSTDGTRLHRWTLSVDGPPWPRRRVQMINDFSEFFTPPNQSDSLTMSDFCLALEKKTGGERSVQKEGMRKRENLVWTPRVLLFGEGIKSKLLFFLYNIFFFFEKKRCTHYWEERTVCVILNPQDHFWHFVTRNEIQLQG